MGLCSCVSSQSIVVAQCECSAKAVRAAVEEERRQQEAAGEEAGG